MSSLCKRLLRVKIENIFFLLKWLEGYGLIVTDYGLLGERLHNMGFIYKRENKKHGTIMEEQKP